MVNYVDLDLIKLLLYNTKSNVLKDKIVNELTALKEEISYVISVGEYFLDRCNYNRNSLEDIKKKLNSCRKEIFKRLTSISLSLTIVTSGALGLNSYLKKVDTASDSLEGNATYSDIYSEEDVIKKDVSNDFVNEQEFYLFEAILNDNNSDSNLTVIESIEDNPIIVLKSLLYLLYICTILLIECINMCIVSADVTKKFKYIGIINNINELIRHDIREYKISNLSCKKYKEEYINNLSNVLKQISMYDDLKDRFDQLYNDNKYLLKDMNELFFRISNLPNSLNKEDIAKQVKSLIRK